jgi:hypothetical protein
MKVGVYIDGYNLYYGARGICGRGTPGWRWLDLRAMLTRVVRSQSGWTASSLVRIVFCTARVKPAAGSTAQRDQDVYLKALLATGSVDHIEYGSYVARVATAPLAVEDRRKRPVLTTSKWPVKVRDPSGNPVLDAGFMVSVARREEKGSDVNVASHLLLDMCDGRIEAAVVVSNDSDLELPLRTARQRLPLGLVNPSRNYLAGALKGDPAEGPGGHWWYRLTEADLRGHQLPDPIGRLTRPIGW